MKSVCLMQDFQAVGAQACKDTLQKLFRDKDILKVTMDGAMVSCHHVCLLCHRLSAPAGLLELLTC